jgi:ABC-type multidrug transport system ATPase subunit
MQDDVFFSRLTVRQTLEFTAAIRHSGRLSAEEQATKVDAVITRLRLGKCQHIIVGDQFHKGISGGERKRLNIGNELLGEPKVLLLDEPTSGLDATTAMTVVRLMRELADEGLTIISTIHQPSGTMFDLFDKVLLLSDGEIAFFGPVSKVKAYFNDVGFPFPPNQNPCDFMLQLLIDDAIMGPSGTSGSLSTSTTTEPLLRSFEQAKHDSSSLSASSTNEPAQQYLLRMWRERGDNFLRIYGYDDISAASGVERKQANVGRGGVARAAAKRIRDVTGKPDPSGLDEKYPTSWMTQVRVLSLRAIRQKRGIVLETTTVFQVALITFICAMLWFRMGVTELQLDDRLGFLFFICAFWSFVAATAALHAFPQEKNVLFKERSSGSYRLSAYYLAKTIVDLPADTLYPLFFSCAVYFTINLNSAFARFISFAAIITLVVWVAISFGQAFSAALMNVKYAQILTACSIMAMMLLGGYYVDSDNIPGFVKPFRYVSFVAFGYEALVRNEIAGGMTYACAANKSLSTVYSASGRICPVTADALIVGAQLENSLSVGANVGILIAWLTFYRLCGYFALKHFHRPAGRQRRCWNGR